MTSKKRKAIDLKSSLEWLGSKFFHFRSHSRNKKIKLPSLGNNITVQTFQISWVLCIFLSYHISLAAGNFCVTVSHCIKDGSYSFLGDMNPAFLSIRVWVPISRHGNKRKSLLVQVGRRGRQGSTFSFESTRHKLVNSNLTRVLSGILSCKIRTKLW